ncbi:DUF1510 family protein [Bacillus sp. DX4.1]|uniref:YrrS family protein n=1 Tax=Bacillus sp. DX4.1 TaxID=3055867 RepID=UPI0025A0EF7F|nr:DUF1510 family protein [Bacillus sp. DX4.1]MDM5188850.1 DUF1510 family protein [Bacillus sp. DX4.1]
MEKENRFQEKQQMRRQRSIVNIGFSFVLLTVSMISYQLFFTSNTKGKESSQEIKVSQLASKDKKTTKSEGNHNEKTDGTKLEEQKNKKTETTGLEEQKKQETEAAKIQEQKIQEQKIQEQKIQEQKIQEQKKQETDGTKLEEQENKSEVVKTNNNENKKEENTEDTGKNTQTNPSWKPIGTEQGAKPEMKFKEGTTDWSEMKKAISYAVDVPESQLIYDFIGNNGTNKAYGNVRDKQNNKKYTVHIDWVENKGWKPVSVQAAK